MVMPREVGFSIQKAAPGTSEPLEIEDEPRRNLNFLDLEGLFGPGIDTRSTVRSSPVEMQDFVSEHLQQFGTAPSPQQIRDFKRGPAPEGLLTDQARELAAFHQEQIPPVFEPTDEEVLANFAPVQVYQARLQDFITAQQSDAQSVLQGFSDQYDAAIKELDDKRIEDSTFTQSAYNRQLAVIDRAFTDAIDQSGVMTEAKGKEILAEAQRLIGQGLSAEEVNQQLSTEFTIPQAERFLSPQGEQFRTAPPSSFIPDITDIQGITGAKLGELLNKGLEISQTAFEQANKPAGLSPEQALEAGRFAQTEGTREVSMRTGTEERDYYGLVQGLGLSLQVEQYMMGRFFEFWNQWMQTGPSRPFLEWLRIEFGG